ncbi:MAG: hypothetical protein NTNFB01_22320 [Nitrospira sp.]|jgi:hypothetical protein
MALIVGAIGEIVVAGMGRSAASLGVKLLTGSEVVVTALAVIGAGVTGGGVMLTCGATVASAGPEQSEGGDWIGRGAGVSRGKRGMVSVAGIGTEGMATGALVGGGDGDEGSGLIVAVAIMAGAGELEIETAVNGAGLTGDRAARESGGGTGGATGNDGRSGSAVTTAMTSSGVRPSNSAF